jgi:hypothetical protein
MQESIGCNQPLVRPPPDISNAWPSSDALSKRVCADFTDNESYWLVAPRNYRVTCASFEGPVGPIACDAWEVPPGFDQLVQSSYGVTLNHVIEG